MEDHTEQFAPAAIFTCGGVHVADAQIVCRLKLESAREGLREVEIQLVRVPFGLGSGDSLSMIKRNEPLKRPARIEADVVEQSREVHRGGFSSWANAGIARAAGAENDL